MVCTCNFSLFNPNICKKCEKYADINYTPTSFKKYVVIMTDDMITRYDNSGNLVEKVILRNTFG